MAAFVGNHAVVALINNYVPLEAVTYYTKPMGLEKEAKLSTEVANPLYDLIMQVCSGSSVAFLICNFFLLLLLNLSNDENDHWVYFIFLDFILILIFFFF